MVEARWRKKPRRWPSEVAVDYREDEAAEYVPDGCIELAGVIAGAGWFERRSSHRLLGRQREEVEERSLKHARRHDCGKERRGCHYFLEVCCFLRVTVFGTSIFISRE